VRRWRIVDAAFEKSVIEGRGSGGSRGRDCGGCSGRGSGGRRRPRLLARAPVADAAHVDGIGTTRPLQRPAALGRLRLEEGTVGGEVAGVAPVGSDEPSARLDDRQVVARREGGRHNLSRSIHALIQRDTESAELAEQIKLTNRILDTPAVGASTALPSVGHEDQLCLPARPTQPTPAHPAPPYHPYTAAINDRSVNETVFKPEAPLSESSFPVSVGFEQS